MIPQPQQEIYDDACRAQLTKEHDGTEFLIAFLSYTFWKPKQMEHH